MNAITLLANSGWLAFSIPAWHHFRRALRRPEEIQRRILKNLLKANTTSAYGQKYRFSEIANYEQFRKRVPIVTYDDLQPWVSRIMRGEQNVLTSEPVTRLLPTSGSSGACKLIPFTQTLQREFNAAIGPWMVDLSLTYPSVPFGASYWSISPAIQTSVHESSTVSIGFDDDSAYLGGIRSWLVETTFAAPSVLRFVGEIECFRYLTLLCLLRRPDLRLVSVWHPSFFTLLLDALPGWWNELLRDIEVGGCQRASGLPPAIRRAVDATSQPRRAQALRRLSPVEPWKLWPNLQVVSCWGDAQAKLAFSELRSRLPQSGLQSKGLLATEAFVSIPFRRHHPVAITSHFFEFIDPHGNIRLANELRAGEIYTVIVSTAGGLWRYRLGDVVEVDGFIGLTPSLRFMGRGSSVSDLCGEKLAEVFVSRAIENACTSLGCAPRFAMLAPEQPSAGQSNYTLFVEGDFPSELSTRLEQELRANPHYALCRELKQLGPVRHFQIADGAYETFCEASLANGRRLGDIKPQALSPRTDWRERFAEKA